MYSAKYFRAVTMRNAFFPVSFPDSNSHVSSSTICFNKCSFFFIDACINMMQGIKECKKDLSHSAFACIVIPSNNRQPIKSYLGLMNFSEIFDEKFHNSVPLYLIYFSLSFPTNLKITIALIFSKCPVSSDTLSPPGCSTSYILSSPDALPEERSCCHSHRDRFCPEVSARRGL